MDQKFLQQHDEHDELVSVSSGDPNLEPMQKKHQAFIYLNCRGAETLISRESAELIPYINSLINGPFKNNPHDKKGYIIIDESASSLFYMIDMYRAWIESGNPSSLALSLNRTSPGTQQYLHASIARRLGFEDEFVNALIKPKKTLTIDSDLFVCYYCKNIYSKDERKAYEECDYHTNQCSCRFNKGCRRIPCHSPIKVEGAFEPKVI